MNADLTQTVPKKSDEPHEENVMVSGVKFLDISESWNDSADTENLSSKENVAPEEEDFTGDFHQWNSTGEFKPF